APDAELDEMDEQESAIFYNPTRSQELLRSQQRLRYLILELYSQRRKRRLSQNQICQAQIRKKFMRNWLPTESQQGWCRWKM
ncbi:hypothetical protein C1X47_32895, partial [Pseudomonas sp. MPR-R2A2]